MKRRLFLQAGGLAAVGSLAGCLGADAATDTNPDVDAESNTPTEQLFDGESRPRPSSQKHQYTDRTTV